MMSFVRKLNVTFFVYLVSILLNYSCLKLEIVKLFIIYPVHVVEIYFLFAQTMFWCLWFPVCSTWMMKVAIGNSRVSQSEVDRYLTLNWRQEFHTALHWHWSVRRLRCGHGHGSPPHPGPGRLLRHPPPLPAPRHPALTLPSPLR